MMAQEDSLNVSSTRAVEMEKVVIETEKWSASEGRAFVPENFHFIRAIHLHFKPVEPKLLAKWKALQLSTFSQPGCP